MSWNELTAKLRGYVVLTNNENPLWAHVRTSAIETFKGLQKSWKGGLSVRSKKWEVAEKVAMAITRIRSLHFK